MQIIITRPKLGRLPAVGGASSASRDVARKVQARVVQRAREEDLNQNIQYGAWAAHCSAQQPGARRAAGHSCGGRLRLLGVVAVHPAS